MASSSAERVDWARLSRLLAVGWTAALAFFLLFRYEAWLVPIQFIHLLGSALPALRVGPHLGEFLGQRAIDLLFLTGLGATALGLGAPVLRIFWKERGFLPALFALGIGFWIVAVAVMIIGFFSVRHVPWVFLGLGAWLLPAPGSLFARPTPAAERWDGWSRWMLAALLAALVFNLLGALTPPFEYDVLEYHLGGPADYLRAGRILFVPYNFYTNFPQLTEMLYLLGLASASDGAAKLLHWAFGALAAGTIYAVAVGLWNRRTALTAAALFYCLPYVLDLSQTARIDLSTTFYGALAVAGLLWWRPVSKHRATLWLAALAAGGAVATKWTAGGVLLLPAVVVVAVITRSWRCSAGYFGLGIVPVAPWLIKNSFLAGNPTYPMFLTSLFPNPHWSPAQAALLAERNYPRFDLSGWLELVTRAWHYAFLEPFASPLLLMTAPLILLVKPSGPQARRAAWLAAAGYASWFLLTFRPWRFLFPLLPAAALVGAVAVVFFLQEKPWRWLVGTAVSAVLVINLLSLALTGLIDLEDPQRVPPRMCLAQYILGQTSRKELIGRLGYGVFEPILWMNDHLPEPAKVLYAGEARVYYARHSVVWSTAYDQHPLTRWSRPAGGVPELVRLLQAEGITHVYVNFSEMERLGRGYRYLADADWNLIRPLLQERAREVHRHGRSIVYELQP